MGSSEAMKTLRRQIRRIGPHFRTVLLRGEPGTGRKLVAQALHGLSRNAAAPFVRCHTTTLEDDLAKCPRRGTLFLDTIDEMALDAQSRLLKALEKHAQGQVIASTNQDIRSLVSAARFHPQLYQRLAVEITVPPLRERREDIPELARHLLERFASLDREDPRRITHEAMRQMQRYRWPGNVRELKDVLRDCVLRTKSRVLEAHHLPVLAEQEQSTKRSVRLQDVVEDHVLRVLKDCGGNKLRAAEMLGISRSTLYRMLGTGAYMHHLH